MKTKQLLFAVVLWVCTLSVMAQAQTANWEFSLTNPDQEGTPSSLLVYNGSITNSTGADLFLNTSTLSFDIGAPASSYSFGLHDSFIDTLGIIPTSGYSGPLFSVQLSSSIPVGAIGTGTLSLSTLAPGTPSSISQSFSAEVVQSDVTKDTAVTITTPNTGNDRNTGTWSLGYAFSPNAPITITDLGFYDAGSNGLLQSHAVGIYNSGGGVLVSGMVSSGDPLDNFFRFTSVAPITLSSGSTYYIVTLVGTELYTDFPTDYNASPAITLGSGWYAPVNTFSTEISALAFPTIERRESPYFGPNFKFAEPVPEPGTIVLLATSLLSLSGMALRRRRLKQTL